METLQLAQMLADLSDLNAAQETEAALALVKANKSLSPPPVLSSPSDVTEQRQRNHHRASSVPAILLGAGNPTKFDKFGRRVLSPPATRPASPHNAASGSSTPNRGQADDDAARASSLMQLYEIRARLRQQDTAGLNRARERINAIQGRQQLASAPPTDRRGIPPSSPSRFAYPKGP